MNYYFKINDIDFSRYVNKLVVGTEHIYKVDTSDMGSEKITYNGIKRRTIEVGIIPLDDAVMAKLLTEVDKFWVSISYRDPKTNVMIENLACYIPNNLVDYYTIQVNKVKYRAFTLQIKEVQLGG